MATDTQISGLAGSPSSSVTIGGGSYSESFDPTAYGATIGATQGGGTHGSIAANQTGQFFNLVTMADQWAAATGWRYFPSSALLAEYVNNGWSGSTPEQFFADLTARMGIWNQPWLKYGLNQNDYNNRIESLNSTLQDLIGPGADIRNAFSNDPAGLSAAIINNQYGSAELTRMFGTFSQYGYLRHGQNYQQFQDYKSQNMDKLNQRYGVGYTDAQAVNNLDTPLTAFAANTSAMGLDQSLQDPNAQKNIRTATTAVR